MANKRQPAKQQAKKKPERGMALSIMLVLVMLSNLLSVFLVLDLTQRPNDPTFPVLLALSFIVSAAKFVAAIAIWRWEKWGIYVYVGGVVASTIIGLLVTANGLIVFNELLPPLILGWLLRDKWNAFGIG